MAVWSTRFYDKVPEAEPLKYEHRPSIVDRHTCTDVPCGLVFIASIAFGVYIMIYANANGDPRKVYHGMNYEGQLCGVDLPWKPYVYWCKSTTTTVGALATGASAWLAPTGLDFEHPICVEMCPESAATQSLCYDSSTGATQMTSDYATHPVAKRYCLPQAQAILDQVNAKMDGHPLQKYLTQSITIVRTGWPVLVGALVVGFILSSIYLLLIECLAGLVIWLTLLVLIVLPGVCGGYLVYASVNGGIDGMPGSGDATTDQNLGIVALVVCAFFLLVSCCMRNAIEKAINVVESAATCLFECKSLLLEPLINLAARITIWGFMLSGLVFLISTGEVRKSKIYRTFTYTDEQYIYLGSYIFLMIWVNDFLTAMSQYVIANAAAKWYFTDHSAGMKLAPNCLLCKGYFNGWIFHFGSLAFGSLLIAFMRPIRIVVLAIVTAEELIDGAACGCVAKVCFCCVECFNSFLVHLSKNAYIDIAISSRSFCAAGANAAELLAKQSKTLVASAGATWLFTLVGLASVTVSGAFITSLVVLNVDTFNTPSSEYYIQDPMVCSALAGFICFFVALCFMTVFDSVTDTMILCLAYDREELKINPVPVWKAGRAEGGGGQWNSCGGFFGSQKPVEMKAPAEVRRPQYATGKMQSYFFKDENSGTVIN